MAGAVYKGMGRSDLAARGHTASTVRPSRNSPRTRALVCAGLSSFFLAIYATPNRCLLTIL
jgi:hypothetical protein